MVYGTVPCGERFRLDSSAITPGFDGVFRHRRQNIWTPAQKLNLNLRGSPLCFNDNEEKSLEQGVGRDCVELYLYLKHML